LEITADEKLIEQVLINLIKNSIYALEERVKPKITLIATSTKDNIYISVKDNGRGIPEGVIDDIFVPFYTTREKGTGIGLSLSRQIMRLHGGNITVSSIPDKETVFVMRF